MYSLSPPPLRPAAVSRQTLLAAGRLAASGEVDVTQGGRVVDIAVARGPVRIRRHRPDGEGPAGR